MVMEKSSLVCLLLLSICSVVNCNSVNDTGSKGTSFCHHYNLTLDPCGLSSMNRTYYIPSNTDPNFESYIEILGIISRALDYRQDDIDCSSHIVPLFCNYLFPPCNNESLPMPLCQNTCYNLTSGPCSTQWNELRKVVGTSDLLQWLLNGLDCSHTYYNASNYAANKTCWDAATPPTPTPDLPDKPYQHDLLMVLVAFIATLESILLLIFIVLTLIMAVACYRKKRRLHTYNIKPSGNSINFPPKPTGTLARIVQNLTITNGNSKIQSQRMLLENIPEPYKEVMSGYTDALLQEDKLQMNTFLADGPCTEVYQGNYSEPQPHNTSVTHFIAVKRFKDPIAPATVSNYLKRLLCITSVKHQNVLKLVGVTCGPKEDIIIAYPYFSEHNLMTYLRKMRLKSEKTADVEHLVDIIHQVSKGMNAMARKGIAYGMLSIDTSLIDGEGVVVVGDLSYYQFVNQVKVNWAPPEKERESACTEASDVWSFGLTAWQILTLGEALPTDSNGTLKKPGTCPDPLYALIQKCLDKDPKRRPIFPDIISEIGSMRSDQTFIDDVSARSLVADAWNCTQEYLVLLPEPDTLDDYQYAPTFNTKKESSSSNDNNNYSYAPASFTVSTSPEQSPSTPHTTLHQVVRRSPSPRVYIKTNSVDEEGYVKVTPPISTSPPKTLSPKRLSTSPLPPLPSDAGSKSSSMKMGPIAPKPKKLAHMPLGRCNSDDREYYNIHFRPPAKKKLSNQLSSTTTPTIPVMTH